MLLMFIGHWSLLHISIIPIWKSCDQASSRAHLHGNRDKQSRGETDVDINVRNDTKGWFHDVLCTSRR